VDAIEGGFSAIQFTLFEVVIKQKTVLKYQGNCIISGLLGIL